MSALIAVGIGPGGAEHMTEAAVAAIRACDAVVGYSAYIELIRELLAGQQVVSSGMKQEVARCQAAVDLALEGKNVCVVSSGDAGVYGMAGLLLELAAPHETLRVEVIPGVTAACSAAAVLGAPLMQDFCVISLSDLLTPWSAIENRLRMAAQADFVLCLYNPASKSRADYLQKACDIVLESRGGETPCGVVRNAMREGQQAQLCTLSELRSYPADMFTTVFIGNSATQALGGRLVTRRGYHV